MTQPARVSYLRSLATELISQSRRVRDLIGDAHWLSDGHHKEYLLLSVLGRHLPAGMIAARGFVLHPTYADVCSKEQDILVVDTTQEAPPFHQGGLMITYPSTVRAAISVKSTLTKSTLEDSVAGLATVRALEAGDGSNHIWTGAYFYEPPPQPTTFHATLRDAQSTHSTSSTTGAPILDFLSTSIDLVYRVDKTGEALSICGYSCDGVATAIFLAEVLDHLAFTRGRQLADFTLFADDPNCHITPIAEAR